MKFGTKVKVLRMVRGWTQNDLVEVSRVSKPYLAVIETGEATPGETIERKLKIALGWTPEMDRAFEILEAGQFGHGSLAQAEPEQDAVAL